VSSLQPGGEDCTNSARDNVPQRFLEGADGVVRLYYSDKVVGTAEGVRSSLQQHTKQSRVRWRRWDIERLRFEHGSSMLRIQGASLQQLIGDRYIVLRGELTPFYDPCPAAKNLVLAEVLSMPKGMTHKELFFLLRPRA